MKSAGSEFSGGVLSESSPAFNYLILQIEFLSYLKQMFQFKSFASWLVFPLLIAALVFSGCGVEAAKQKTGEKDKPVAKDLAANSDQATAQTSENFASAGKIEVKPNSPAETVNAFFARLREKRFREAIFLTNLRPAVEGLTEAELQDLQVDFAALAQAVSPQIVINGEVVSGDSATVMAKIPDMQTGQNDVQTFRLRKKDNYWTILTVDDKAEKLIQKEGKNYFFNLRIETHQTEAKKMIEKISQAEMIHAVQNGGVYADLPTLLSKGLISEDVMSSETAGYNFAVAVFDDGKSYRTAAIPAQYGKTGRLSYSFEIGEKIKPRMFEKDNNGQILLK